jgi:succinate dehydrogenase/fumarate reductase flavoprotein subunit
MSRPNPDYDIVVAGAGGAGLSAAVAAAEAGARTLLLESERQVGGSMAQSAGMFTAAGTSVQRALGVADDPGRFYQHYMDLNQWRLRPGLIRTFCEQAAPTFEWLLGLGLQVPARESTNAHMSGLTRAGVEDIWRGHVPEGGGTGVVAVLEAARRARGVEVVFGSRVEGLLLERGSVRGVRVDGTDLHAGAVVVATGGMAQNRPLVERFYPDVLEAGPDLFAISGAGSRGDHVALAAQAGADMVGEGWGMLLLTAYFQRHHHWQAGFPPPARVTVDMRGRRFMDEDASYAIGAGIAADQRWPLWMIFDETARAALAPGYVSWTPDGVAAEAASGRTICRPTLSGLAETAGISPSTLVATIERWNAHLPVTGIDPDFERHLTLAAKGADPHLPKIATPPYYAVRIVPGELVVTHYGMRIDSAAAVLDLAGAPIPGLFAAGEAGGGVLGPRYVGGGNAISNAITMGRIAGQRAASQAGKR